MCSYIIPMHTTQGRPACSGKCVGMCSIEPSIWVVAACDGLISLFKHSVDGRLTIVPQGDAFVSPSVEVFGKILSDASKKGLFNRLVLIGAAQDIAWIQLSLPEGLAKQIVAEIDHPLPLDYFQKLPDFHPLISEIRPLLEF